MKKQPEVTNKTKKAFMDAFCEMYTQKPIERISVQEITNKAGYNRSSFYQHFCDIYDLLDYLESSILSSLNQKLHGGDEGIHEILSLSDEKSLYLNALFGNFGSNHFLERLKASIPFESHGLNISKDDPLTPYLMEFHLSTVLSLFRLWYQREKDLPQEELFKLMQRLYTNGVSAILKI